MSRTYVRGKDVNLYVRRDEVWVFTACATSLTKEEVAEELNITTADSTRENEYIGGAKDATISFDGVITLDELPGYQFKDFDENTGNVIEILVTYDNVLGDRYSYECNALITSVSSTANTTDFATYSVTMKRSGAATTTLVLDCLLDSEGNPITDSNGYPIR